MHPEFALSRREIIKYVLTPAGERSKDVQILLRLDQIEKVRASLQRVANGARKEHASAQTEFDRAQHELNQYLGLKSPTMEDMLAAVNERRTTLKLEPIEDLAGDRFIKEGIVASAGKEAAKRRLSKAGTLADLQVYQNNYDRLAGDDLKGSATSALILLKKLAADPAILKSFRQKVLVELGLSLINEELCPLCDTPWNLEELKAHLWQKEQKASAAKESLAEFRDIIAPVCLSLENFTIAAKKIVQACGLAEPTIDANPLSDFVAACDADLKVLEKLEADPSTIALTSTALARFSEVISPGVEQASKRLWVFAEGLPEPSKEEAAKEYLIVAQEKYNRCGTKKVELAGAAERAALSSKVSEEYGKVSNEVLERIYDTVQKDFTKCYTYVNRDDEDKFEGLLTSSVGKLSFDVDFYGRGKFPPGAYHSEGHQDAMGLCLYLALMKHTLGEKFTLAVLDDVLMSVDAAHRREV